MIAQTAPLELLGDLLCLLKKYGPETFDELAVYLSNGQLGDDLNRLITPLVKIAKKNSLRGKRGVNRINGSREELLELRKRDPAKADILLRFYEGLVAKEYLPTIRDVRNFALDCGIPDLRSSARQKAVSELIRAIASQPTTELERRIEAISLGKTSTGNGLEGWNRIILNQRRTTTGEQG